MGFASSYLFRHSFHKPFITEAPHPGTSLIVVIPSYNEPSLLRTLASLTGADRPSCPAEVIVVVNAPENAPEEVRQSNLETIRQAREWSRMHGSGHFPIHILDVPHFPVKHAGAGFARKIGMDEAVHRFSLLGNPRGIIVSFDADSLCDANYFTEIERCFADPRIHGCTIYFEHPDGEGCKPDNPAIAIYELYLRYFVQAMRHAGYPYAFHTIGSCFAVNAQTYCMHGGMNRKTAGEDFYFLHKIFQSGGITELNTTRVIPSARISGRVPFGTGATMKRLSQQEIPEILTWPPESFTILGSFLSLIPSFYGASSEDITGSINKLPACICNYLHENNFIPAADEMNRHSASPGTFRKRFFSWFSGLRLLKYLNYARGYRPDMAVTIAARKMPEIRDETLTCDSFSLLNRYRILQRSTTWKC